MWSLCASAFQDRIVHLKGVTVTATRSATRLCGVDFLIAVTDRDKHFVMIDFTYNGAFTTRPAWESVPALAEKGSRGGVINVSVGPLTYGGMLDRAAAIEWPENTLVCTEAWAFHFVADEVNMSQAQRDKDAGLRQQVQDKIDAANRRKAAEEERKREAAQLQLDHLKREEQAKYSRLEEYRKANPASSRCILRVDDPDSVAKCNQWMAREREEKSRQDAAALEAQRKLEADRQAAELREAQQRERDALSDLVKTNPCAAAEVQRRSQAQALQQDQQYNYPPAQLAQRQAQWKQAQSALEAMCAATRNKQQTLKIQAQQQQRLQAQQKARADLDAAIQEGKKTVNQAETATQTMKNDNADLMDMINRLK
jgi:hypothetical protein